MRWLPYALLSAAFAGATAILGKLGVSGIPSNLATAVRTVVILIFAWTIVVARGEHRALAAVEPRTLLFLVLSGVTTGLSWLAYFRALQLGPASRVAPIDKLSLPFVILLAWLFLGEAITTKSMIGVGLIVVGAVLTIR